MENQKVRKFSTFISVLTGMMLSVLIVLPVHAATDDEASYAAVFDSTYYASNNPDLQAAYGNNSGLLLNHFITCGMKEGRQGNAEFNVQYYQAAYPDLQAVFNDNLKDYYLHYITCGKSEGRVGNGVVQNKIPDAGNSVEIITDNVNPDAGDGSGYAYEVLELVNQARAENGLGPLSTTPELMNAAQIRATELVTSFSHTRPDGSACFTAFDQNGVNYHTAGENIATGQQTPASVMKGWLNSPGHRANILNESFNHIGIGCYQTSSGYGIYWTQCFTN